MRWLLVILGMVMTGTPALPSMIEAVNRRDMPALTAAIARGDDLEQRNAKGQTPLLTAVWANDLAAARALIAAGADVNAKDNIKDSPYLVAGAEGRTEILELILIAGADLASTNRYGGTALIPAAEKGHPEAVALLIKAGVNLDHVNDLGWTALLEAVILTRGEEVHQNILRQLLDAGADPNIPDANGVTALEHAQQRGFSEMAQILEAATR